MELAALKIVKPDGSEHPVTAIMVFFGSVLIYTANGIYIRTTDDLKTLRPVGK